MVQAEYEKLDLNERGRDVSSTPESERDYEALPDEGSRPKVDIKSLAKRVGMFVLALLILPYLLIPVYAIPFIRPVSTLMLADLVTFQGYDRQWVPLEDISPRLVQSVMMSEDGQFCFHDGVDWNQMQGVVNDALEGEATRGASTIPMQTAKNLFLWNGRSFIRKGLELPLALVSDFIWSKKRMMEIYLNIAEWGPGVYGIEAAAQYHFKGAGFEAQFAPGRIACRGIAEPDRSQCQQARSRHAAPRGAYRAPGQRLRRVCRLRAGLIGFRAFHLIGRCSSPS